MRKVALVRTDVNLPAPAASRPTSRTVPPHHRAAVASSLYIFGDEERARPVKASSTGRWQRKLKLFAPLVLLLAVIAAWYFGDLAQLKSPEKIASLARSLRESPWAPAYIVVAFSLGSMLFFPITALQTATVLVFDPLQAFAYGYVGTMFAAMMTYWVGRLLGSEVLAYVRGPKIARFQQLLRTKAVRASIAARLLPVGNFTLINMLTGSMHVPFGSYVLGNLVGIVPGLVLLTLFADQLATALWTADTERLIALGAVLGLGAGVWFYFRWRARNRARAQGRTSLAE